MEDIATLVRTARHSANLSQAELATRVQTSQSAIANLERGRANPTVETLIRIAAATGRELRISLDVPFAYDQVVERYKQDVDRSLLRENVKHNIDYRIRTLGEWQEAGRELESATRAAKHAAKRRA